MDFYQNHKLNENEEIKMDRVILEIGIHGFILSPDNAITILKILSKTTPRDRDTYEQSQPYLSIKLVDECKLRRVERAELIKKEGE